ncbi:MAG: antitermination regulator [Eubacterium sp.]|nr:antitermination regulator [Eubacterium sp.]
MSLKNHVYSVLLVSVSEPFNTTMTEILPPSHYEPVRTVGSISGAKREFAEKAFDFVIVNAPLPDEQGTRFAVDCCLSPETVVLLLVRRELHEEIYEKVFRHGVFTLPKPTTRSALLQALSWMAVNRERLRKAEQKVLSIEDRMKEIRIVNRAKYLLISERKMSEPEAHRYL